MRPPLRAAVLAGAVAIFALPSLAQLPRNDPTRRAVDWHGHAVVRDRLLVEFAPGTSVLLRRRAHTSVGARHVKGLRGQLELAQLPSGSDLDAALSAYARFGHVAHVQPDVLMQPADVPDDPKWALQWGLARIGASQAWDGLHGRPEVVVAILDSGVKTDHPDLAAQYAWGWDTYDDDPDPYDLDGHGTHCAGIAAAATDNGIGMAGAARACRFAAYRCGDGSFPTSALVAAVDDAVDRGAHVLSMSWGSTHSNIILRNALRDARDAGCLLVAAAGNDASNGRVYPAGYDFVLGVGASSQDDGRASFSNYGDWVSLAAPGQGVYSTWKNGGYAYLNGTSMACPLVAGMGALLYAGLGEPRSPAAAARVRAALESSALDVGQWVVHGRVRYPDALAALSKAAPEADGLLPQAVTSLDDESVILHGLGLLGVTAVHVDGLPASEVTVLDDRRVRFRPPAPRRTGSLDVVAMEGTHTSAPVALDVQAVAAPDLLVPAWVPGAGQVTWRMGGPPDGAALLLIGFGPDTLTYRGHPLLFPFHILGTYPLDAAGLATRTISLPPDVTAITFHSQIAAFRFGFRGTSPVRPTTIGP